MSLLKEFREGFTMEVTCYLTLEVYTKWEGEGKKQEICGSESAYGGMGVRGRNVVSQC